MARIEQITPNHIEARQIYRNMRRVVLRTALNNIRIGNVALYNKLGLRRYENLNTTTRYFDPHTGLPKYQPKDQEPYCMMSNKHIYMKLPNGEELWFMIS